MRPPARAMLLAALCALPIVPHAAEPESPKDVRTAVLWSLLPGGGYFYLDDPVSGFTYAGLTAALLAGGLEVERRNQRLDRDDEVNVPWLVADKVWEFSIFTTFRTALTANGADLRASRFDDTPTVQLLTAPFRREALSWPVAGAALFGVAGGVLSAHGSDDGKLSEVRRARMLGATYDRDDATRLYALSAFGVSLGAATAEESLFRGVLQPVAQESLGEARGRWAAAGLFGAAHLVSLDGELNPAGVIFATGAGGYLGWLYDHDGARLSRPIAAHFWYDFALLATNWALDPDNTPFGFSVEFSY